jgi:beta-lactamase regulating signal transducer with metallopeptidase domain
MDPIGFLNSFSESWALFMIDRTLGTVIVFVLAGLLWFLFRNRLSPQWGYLLFLLVLLKAITPYQPFGLIALSSYVEKPAECVETETPNQPLVNKDVITFSNLSILNRSENAKSVIGSNSQIQNRRSDTRFLWIQPLSTQSYLLLSWLFVVICLLIRLLYSELRISQILEQTQSIDTRSLPVDFSELCHDAGLMMPVQLYSADWVRSPFAAGIIRPVIVIPKHFLVSCQPSEIRWIILHELAHIRRCDPLIKFIQNLIQIVFFFHPIVWITNRIIDCFREFSCDDAAMVRTDSSPEECGEGFLRIVLLTNTPVPVLPGTVSLFYSKRLIKERLMRIINHNRSNYTFNTFTMALVMGVVALLTIPTGVISSQAQNVESENSTKVQAEVVKDVKNAKQKTEKKDFKYDTKFDTKHDTKHDIKFDIKHDIKYDIKFDPKIKEVSMSDLVVDVDVDIDVPDVDVDLPEFEVLRKGAWNGKVVNDKFKLNHTSHSKDGVSNFNRTYQPYSKMFEGLDSVISTSTVSSIEFVLESDAGTIAYTGSFETGLGSGHYTFTPDTQFVQKLRQRGIEGTVKDHHLFIFTTHGFQLQTLDRLKDLGYTIDSFKQVESICLFHVTPEYIIELQKLGYSDIPFKQLVNMRIHGVSHEFIKGFQNAGYSNLSVQELINMRIHGVKPEFIQTLAKQGYTDLSAKQLVNMRIHGVSHEFIKGFQNAGYTNLSVQELINMRIHGVKPESIQTLAKLGYTDLSPKELINMRIHNVSEDYITSFFDLGYKNISLKEFTNMKIHNVKPEFVKEIDKLGYTNVSVKNLIDMRIHNVSPEYIKKANKAEGKKLSINDLVNCKIHNRYN